MAELAIEAHSLVKRYGDLVAVAGIDIAVAQGTIYAVLGPNGAGKTTTIHILTTLIPPTAGSAAVAGYDVVKQADKVRTKIGVTFQDIVLDPDLTGRQLLDIHGRLYRLSAAQRRARMLELVELVQLGDAIDRQVRTYSGGMKRRLELARGLMTEPQILFLDEPTQGLDPQNRAGIWSYIRQLNKQHGLTLLLTTHYMEEAESLADHVGIIDQGKMVRHGTPAELIATIGDEVIRVRGQGDPQPFVNQLAALPYVSRVEQDAERNLVLIYVDNSSQRVVDIVGAASGNSYQIDDITLARPSLGDVFLRLTGSALRD